MSGTRAASVPRVLVGLRDMIAQGELRPGERVAELAIVARLGLSRTPVRAALARLQEEGLLEKLPGGGYAVAAFSQADVLDTIELRGTLEGLAARLAAERGAAADDIAALESCLCDIDLALAGACDTAVIGAYAEHNARFHTGLAALCRSAPIQRQIARVAALPFASPNAFAALGGLPGGARATFVVAQSQHRALLDAIACRQGARAEAIAREHARISMSNLRLVFLGEAWKGR